MPKGRQKEYFPAGKIPYRVKMKIIKKRGLKEWLADDNLLILKGFALQCLRYEDLAECIGVTYQTLLNWRKKSAEFAEAIEMGREEGDAVILAVSFESTVRGDPASLDRWWRYRLAPKFERDKSEDEAEKYPTIIIT